MRYQDTERDDELRRLDEQYRQEAERRRRAARIERERERETYSRDRRADESIRIAQAVRRGVLMVGMIAFLAFAAVSPALGHGLHEAPKASPEWLLEGEADTLRSIPTTVSVKDLRPLDRSVRRHLFGREGYRPAMPTSILSVRPFPFSGITDETVFARAAIIVEAEPGTWEEKFLGRISIENATAEKMLEGDHAAVMVLFHEYLHAVAPKASEPLVDAVAFDVTRSYFKRRGEKVGLRIAQGSYYIAPNGGSHRIRWASARRAKAHPLSPEATKIRRELLLRNRPASSGGGGLPGPDKPPAKGEVR